MTCIIHLLLQILRTVITRPVSDNCYLNLGPGQLLHDLSQTIVTSNYDLSHTIATSNSTGIYCMICLIQLLLQILRTVITWRVSDNTYFNFCPGQLLQNLSLTIITSTYVVDSHYMTYLRQLLLHFCQLLCLLFTQLLLCFFFNCYVTCVSHLLP